MAPAMLTRASVQGLNGLPFSSRSMARSRRLSPLLLAKPGPIRDHPATMPDDRSATRPIDRLLAIMARLRDRNGGCPWDLEQTYATIAPHTDRGSL